ncbi:MAG: DUF116 domain-containing protein [bacterium]
MDKPAGRTYSLDEEGEYYRYIAAQVDKLCSVLGGPASLDRLLTRLIKKRGKEKKFESLFAPVSAHLLKHYTPALPGFIASRPVKSKYEEIFGISVRGYHLRMLHIELLNRLMRDDFHKARDKVVILPHCLRDFRSDDCLFEPGDVDYICMSCTPECLINQAGRFLEAFPDYHLYVSQITDLAELFDKARRRYPDPGLLGVACFPELYEGMTLSRSMGIPAQGVPLNYNRCNRWLGEARYTDFNLNQFKRSIFS